MTLYSSDMCPRKVIFATNVTRNTGAGHVRRLFEIAKALPDSIERRFFGSIEIPWVENLVSNTLPKVDLQDCFAEETLVILDSYEREFCLQVDTVFGKSRIFQIADRYTFLLPNTALIFMDLPFDYSDSSVASRTIAHGIEYLPIRQFQRHESSFFKGQATRVLITTGGLTNRSMVYQLIEELSKREYREVEFNFIGPFESAISSSSKINFHQFGKRFDIIAGDCDTAISASGTTMWDLFANGKLVGLAATIENQKANFDYAIENGQALGVFDLETLKLNAGDLQSLLFNSSVRQSLYEQISGRYDFNGASRVCDVILKAF